MGVTVRFPFLSLTVMHKDPYDVHSTKNSFSWFLQMECENIYRSRAVAASSDPLSGRSSSYPGWHTCYVLASPSPFFSWSLFCGMELLAVYFFFSAMISGIDHYHSFLWRLSRYHYRGHMDRGTLRTCHARLSEAVSSSCHATHQGVALFPEFSPLVFQVFPPPLVALLKTREAFESRLTEVLVC